MQPSLPLRQAHSIKNKYHERFDLTVLRIFGTHNSLECENLNPEDAALHAFLHSSTASARVLTN